MKVSLCHQILPTDAPTHLHMEPESERDLHTLEQLISDGRVAGFGVDPRTGLTSHVQVQLIERKRPALVKREPTNP